MLELLNNPIIIQGIIALVGGIYSFLKVKGKINENWQKILEESVKVGVTRIYQDEIRDLKKGSIKKNKLSSTQTREARAKAMNIASRYAKSKGKNILRKFGPDIINVLIEETINKFKK